MVKIKVFGVLQTLMEEIRGIKKEVEEKVYRTSRDNVRLAVVEILIAVRAGF